MWVLLLALFVAAVSCQHHPGHHMHGHAQRTNVTCTSVADCDSVTCMDGLVKSCPDGNHHLAHNHLFHCVCHLRVPHNKRAVGSPCTTEHECQAYGQGHCQHSHGHNNHMHCNYDTNTCYCDEKTKICRADADCTCHKHDDTAHCNMEHTNANHPDGHCECKHNGH